MELTISKIIPLIILALALGVIVWVNFESLKFRFKKKIRGEFYYALHKMVHRAIKREINPAIALNKYFDAIYLFTSKDPETVVAKQNAFKYWNEIYQEHGSILIKKLSADKINTSDIDYFDDLKYNYEPKVAQITHQQPNPEIIRQVLLDEAIKSIFVFEAKNKALLIGNLLFQTRIIEPEGKSQKLLTEQFCRILNQHKTTNLEVILSPSGYISNLLYYQSKSSLKRTIQILEELEKLCLINSFNEVAEFIRKEIQKANMN